MNKKYFYNLGLVAKKDSTILHNNKSYHNSVYLAGYVLESYLKILLLVRGKSYRDIILHLNQTDATKPVTNLLNEVKMYLNLFPHIFVNSKLLSESKLVSGMPGNKKQTRWNVNGRYYVDNWNNADFSNDIQKEISIVEQELNNLKINGVI